MNEIEKRLENIERRLENIEQLLLPFQNKNNFSKFFIAILISNSIFLYGLIKFIEALLKILKS